MARTQAVQRVAEIVQDHLDAILAQFKPGMKITVIVRHPDNEEKDFMMGNDTLDGAIQVLERCKERSPG